MCNLGTGERPTFFKEGYPKARKTHTCCECGGAINKGEAYQQVTGLWDDFQTFKTCSFCADARDQAEVDFDLNSDEGFPFGELWDCVGMDYLGVGYRNF